MTESAAETVEPADEAQTDLLVAGAPGGTDACPDRRKPADRVAAGAV